MTQQDALLSSLLKSEQRRPVDVNLGQVPITPTIGRMGNYSVVTRETLKDNPASELSRALSQLPQLLGQAKNISVAAGLKQAEEMDLEEIEKRWNNGDTEAEGFMTWLGGNKAFQEAAYQRLFDASIKPNLQKVSSEIDGMTNGELLQFDSDESIKEYAQSRLVGSLAPGILDTVRTNSWLAVRHNRAMEAIIPNYVQKAAASIDARKRDFQEKEALAAVETNFLTQAETPIQTEYIVPEFANPDDPRVQIERELFDQDAANQRWVDNLQYSLDFATDNGFAGRLDKFQIEAQLIPALTAKYRMLIEDEDHSAADLFLEAMESGSLNINGRPINKSSAGMRLIQNAEALLENALEDDQAGIDMKKINGIKSDTLRFLSGEKVKQGYDPDSMIPLLQQQENDLYNDPANPMSNKEIIELSGFFARTRDGVRGRGEIHSETSDEKRKELGEKFRKTYKSVNPEEIAVSFERDALEKAFLDAGGDPEFWDNQLTTTILDPEGQKPPKVVFQNPASRELADAASQASRSTVATFIDRPIEELFLGDVASDDIEKQSQLRTQITDKADEFFIKEVAARLLGIQESFKAQNPPLTPKDERIIEANTPESRQIRRKELRELASGGLIGPQGVIKPVVVKPSGYSREKDTYPLGAINTTLKNSIGAREFKKNLPQARVTALIGAYTDSIDEEVLLSQAIDLESIVGQPEYDTLLKNEIESKKYVGIPLNTLYAGGREFTHMTDRKWYHGLVDGAGGKSGSRQTKSAILYNKYENFSKPEETKKRIFNLPAVVEYLQDGDERKLKNIHNSLLKGKMPLEEFIKNQADFFESFAGSLTDVQTPQQTNK